MPEIPRDPRQLARDILAGKISIEEIARQRQARAASTAPRQIPKPAIAPPVQRQTPQPQRPVQPAPRPRPAQAPQPQRRPQAPQARPQAPAPSSPPQPAMRPRAVTPEPPMPVTSIAVPQLSRYTSAPLNISSLTTSRQALRQAIIMAEILGPPVALRDNG